ncbi:hypothetical protein AAHE18_20G200800 [Arachis hypogaea]
MLQPPFFLISFFLLLSLTRASAQCLSPSLGFSCHSILPSSNLTFDAANPIRRTLFPLFSL